MSIRYINTAYSSLTNAWTKVKTKHSKTCEKGIICDKLKFSVCVLNVTLSSISERRTGLGMSYTCCGKKIRMYDLHSEKRKIGGGGAVSWA